MSNRKSLLAAAIALACSVSFSAHAAAEESRKIEIPAGDLRVALESLARQAGIELVYRMDHVDGVKTNGVSGELAPRDAAERLIEGTSLELRVDPSGAMLITAPAQRSTGIRYERDASVLHTSARSGEGYGRQRLAQTESSTVDEASASSQKVVPDNTPNSAKSVVLEDVLVTGSHIRGAQNAASPMITIEREEIDRAGYRSVQEVIRDLPQNLSSISERMNQTFLMSGGASDAQTKFSAGADLRGLGGDSTLVLLNGRRVARAGQDTHVDLSLIPVSAIERVEVLTDGASALYGSDAVGGVINMITRKDFDGAEVRGSYGAAAHSSYATRQASGLFGRSWNSGQLMVSYERGKETPLLVWDRFDNLNGVNPETALIQESERSGAIIYLEQKLSDRIRLDAEATHGQRATPAAMSYDMGVFGGYMRYEVDSKNSGAGVGLTADLSSGWQLRASAGFDQTEGEFLQWFGAARDSMAFNYANETAGDVRTVNAIADGVLLETASGAIRLAVGGEGRRDNWLLHSSSPGVSSIRREAARDVAAAFAEFSVPIVGEANRKPALRSLDLTIAGRFEDYNDFGSTFNPKFGLAWVPFEGLKLRGTAGTSFKAPTLSQMLAQTDNTIYIGYYSDANGPVNVFEVSGVAPRLQPEKSKNWSFGFDYASTAVSELQLSATLFGIDYDDRIGSPFPPGYYAWQALVDPAYRYMVSASPSLADLRALTDLADTPANCWESTPLGLSPCGGDPQALDYLLDTRTRNLAKVSQRGVDLALQYGVASELGYWSLSFGGSKLLDATKVYVPGGIEYDQLNQVHMPVDLRLRAAVGLSSDAGWSVHASARYVDGYHDTAYRLTGSMYERRSRVSSWTTVDLSAQYDLNRLLGLDSLGGLVLQFNANNVFDRSPPYVATYYGLNYDPVNSDATGRYVSVLVKAQW